MGMRSLVALLLLVVLAAFAAANWGAFVAPTELTLGVARVHWPLGLLMLGLCALLLLGLGGLALWVHARSLMDLRRQLREQQSLRERADNAESSRLVQLQAAVREGFDGLSGRLDTLERQLGERIDTLQHEHARQVAQGANDLAAALAEVDRRVAEALPREG